jgi:carboxyl-terminal processing protease
MRRGSMLCYYTIAILVAAVAACSSVIPGSGPEVRAAVQRIAAYAEPSGTSGVASPDLDLFAHVYDLVRRDYVHEVDGAALLSAAVDGAKIAYDQDLTYDSKIVHAAISGMLATLDKYSVFLDGDEYNSIRDETKGEFGGIGIEVSKGDGFIEVVTPLDGTPGAKAGLAAGDRITHANGFSLAQLTFRDAVRRLRGRVGTRVTLTIDRDGVQPFETTVIRAVIKIKAVRWRLEEKVGYVRITSFTERTGGELQKAVVGIRRELGESLIGLVIDLRNNPGGLLNQSINVSDALLDRGKIVSTRGRKYKNTYSASFGDIARHLPIVVLVNRGSASAAEIVAGALKDHGRALLIGEKTFGKGSVQTIIPMDGQQALKLTTALYYTPSGKTVDGGISPDIVVEMDDALDGDEQLQRALAEIRRLASS